MENSIKSVPKCIVSSIMRSAHVRTYINLSPFEASTEYSLL